MVSEQDRAAARQILPGYGGRIEVVPNGVDCHRNRPGLAQPAANTLVFNGALTYSANYDAIEFFLADILPLVRLQEPELSLTITGSTSGVDLAGLPLDDSVRFSGYVEDVRPLVAGAWACIAPIRQGAGTRLKILEAMALGTPVVATAKGAEGLDVTPGGDILLAEGPAEFANQLVRLLHDPGLRGHLAGNARRLVEERYDWEEIGQRFVEMVSTVIGR
jgi:glycosyltransferase involved in cell wall biosynthesis